jgi:S1-C subfamily serine protease
VVWRKGTKLNISVKVGNRELTIAASAPGPARPRSSSGGLLRRPDRPQATPATVMGLELALFDESASKQYQLPSTLKGVLVTSVAPDSPVKDFLEPLDIITSIDGHEVRTAQEATKAIEQRSNDTPMLLVFDRVVRGVVERRSVKIP